jgi:hypothetical protein
MAQTTKPEREEWQHRRLRILPLKSHDELTPFLNDLADKVIGIGSDVVIINALGQDFEAPKEFLTANPFFQISDEWSCDVANEQLHTRHSGFSANYLESEEIWEPYKTTFHELGKTNHLLVTITRSEIDQIPESFWQRMPCDRETLIQYVEQDRKAVFGVREIGGLYTLLVAAAKHDGLKEVLTDFLTLKAIPMKRRP